MNYIEFLHNRDKYLGENHDDFLMHYGVLGQKWGQRHWQNPDGTYTTEGKIRYFGSKKAQAEMNADETKIGSKTSDAKDYLKFRNKMLKERTRPDLNEWYRDKNKYLDKQLVRDAKRVDKQQEKMYKNQLKDWYDNPEDLVSDLNAMYKIGGKGNEVGSLYSTGKAISNLFPKKGITEDGEEFDSRYQNQYGYLTEKGKKLLEKNPEKFKEKVNQKLYEQAEKEKAELKTKEKEEKERKERETQERVQSLDNEIITDKYPKSSDKLTEEEFNKIANDLDTWYEDFHDGKTDKHSNTLVADLGINAMNNARGAGYAEVGDNGDRNWFMWEDQTLGLPDIAYLYTKGYSKDYIKGMLKYGKEKMYNLSDEDYENFRDKYPATSFVINEYHDGDKYIDSLFELKDLQDQKIGGLFSKKTDEEKAEKRAQKEADKINDFLDEEYETDRRHWSEVMNSFTDSNSEYASLFEELRKSNDERLAKDYEKVEKIFDDYDNNEDEYVTRAAIAGALINDPNATLGEIGWMSRFYLMDDGDQGYANSANLYARYEKNLDIKELQKLYTNINYNKEMMDDNIKYLKDNNPVLAKIKDKYLQEMVKENEDMNYWNKNSKLQSSLSDLYNATDSSVENGNLERNAYNNAKKITNKLHKSCSGDSGWDYLNQAIENLNLSSAQVNNLSDSDWNRINAEIERLKK